MVATRQRVLGWKPPLKSGKWRGYVRRPELEMRLDWVEAGLGERAHALTFWLRPLEQAA